MLSDQVRGWLQERGLDPQTIDGRGKHQDRALILARGQGELPIVQELLAVGAEIRLRSLDGYTALDLAGNIDVLRLLQQADKQKLAESEVGC